MRAVLFRWSTSPCLRLVPLVILAFGLLVNRDKKGRGPGVSPPYIVYIERLVLDRISFAIENGYRKTEFF